MSMATMLARRGAAVDPPMMGDQATPRIILEDDARTRSARRIDRPPCPRPSPPPRARSTRSSGSRATGLSAQELLEQAAARIERVVPTDGYFMAATDPETTLCIGTGLVSELPADQCQPHWDYEFLVPDYLKYADIARSGRRVADIHDATAGRPERSPRFKQYQRGDRASAPRCASPSRSATRPGASRSSTGMPAERFTDDEKAWLERAAPSARARPAPGHGGRAVRPPWLARGPGIVLLDGGGARGVGDPRGRRVARRARRRAADRRTSATCAALPRPRLRHARPRGARGRRAADPLAAAHAPRRLAAHARRGRSRAPARSRSSSSRRSPPTLRR